MKTEELPDNISICSECGIQTDDNEETIFDKYGDPYCSSCYKEE